MNKYWEWDKQSRMFIWGECNDGCTVFTQPRGWYASVFILGKYIPSLAPFDNLDDAKDAAVEKYELVATDWEKEHGQPRKVVTG